MICFSGRPTDCSGLLQDAVNEVFGAILQIDIEMKQSWRFTLFLYILHNFRTFLSEKKPRWLVTLNKLDLFSTLTFTTLLHSISCYTLGMRSPLLANYLMNLIAPLLLLWFRAECLPCDWILSRNGEDRQGSGCNFRKLSHLSIFDNGSKFFLSPLSLLIPVSGSQECTLDSAVL